MPSPTPPKRPNTLPIGSMSPEPRPLPSVPPPSSRPLPHTRDRAPLPPIAWPTSTPLVATQRPVAFPGQSSLQDFRRPFPSLLASPTAIERPLPTPDPVVFAKELPRFPAHPPGGSPAPVFSPALPTSPAKTAQVPPIDFPRPGGPPSKKEQRSWPEMPSSSPLPGVPASLPSPVPGEQLSLGKLSTHLEKISEGIQALVTNSHPRAQVPPGPLDIGGPQWRWTPAQEGYPPASPSMNLSSQGGIRGAGGWGFGTRVDPNAWNEPGRRRL